MSLAYLVASIGRGSSSTDLRARVELGMAPKDWEKKSVSCRVSVGWKQVLTGVGARDVAWVEACSGSGRHGLRDSAACGLGSCKSHKGGCNGES